MGQIQSLLKPVKEEEERLMMNAGDISVNDAIKHDYTDFNLNDVSVTTDAEQKKIDAANT